MKKKILAILSLVLIFSACSNDKTDENSNSNDLSINNQALESENTQLKQYKITIYDYFDTITNFTAYAKDEEEFEKYKSILEDNMKYYHQQFSSYDEFEGINNFYTINKFAGKEAVKVDQVVIDLIKEGKKWYEETDGDINIAAGSVIKIWTDFRDKANANPENAKLPDKQELIDKSKHTNIDDIEIDEENKTVFIKDKDLRIDNGAIGKGYATEKIKEKLIEAGLEKGILSVGGDVAIIGDNPSRENNLYAIGIQNPDLKKENDYPSIVYVKDISVVTSGDYQRYFEIDGRKYHHIIDPKTLEPSTRYKSISVIAEDIAKADALSTALFLKSIEDGKKLAEKYEAEVMWIDENNKEIRTEGYKKFEEE